MQSNIKRYIAAEHVEGISFSVARTGRYETTKVVPELIGKHGFYMRCNKPTSGNNGTVWYAAYLGEGETQSFFSLRLANFLRGVNFNRETGEISVTGYSFGAEMYQFYAW